MTPQNISRKEKGNTEDKYAIFISDFFYEVVLTVKTDRSITKYVHKKQIRAQH
jgi:hypothetical protein